MRFPRRRGRCFGSCVLVLVLLGHALAHVSGQAAPANRSLTASSAKTDHDITIPLGFAEQSIPDAMEGVLYESSVQAIGGSGLYEFSVTGDLPPGFSMETGANTIAFGGIPTTAGTYEFQVVIRDADGTSFKRDFSLRVSPRVLGAAILRGPATVADTETITVTDVPSVFFPVVLLDNETIHTTDAVKGVDSVEVVDYEVVTLNDAVTGLDAAEAGVNESITTTDTITIAVRTVPRIYWTTPAPITYGTPLSPTQLDATGGVDGKLTYTPPAGTVLPAGLQTLSVTLTPNDTTQYAPATDTVTITVNQAAQSITFTPPTSPITFPVSPITLSATGGASGNPVVFSVVSGPGTVSGTNGSTLTITNAGTVVVAANQAGNTNFSAAPQVTQTIVVNPPAVAILLSPTPGSTFKSNNVTFTWTAGMGATMYDLYLGTTLGSNNLYQTGHTTALSTIANIPTNGATVYARLLSFINGAWQHNDYTFTEGSMAVLTSPVQGSTLTGASVTFKWTAGQNVTAYDLYVGTGVGLNNIYQTGHITATSTVATHIPTTGATIYVRLFSMINGAWQTLDYTFTEATLIGTPAAITSPTNGATLGSSNVTFNWTPGSNVTQYDLYLGTTVGSNNLYQTGHITATSTTVPHLPSTGAKVYARLMSLINGAWQYNDYVYTEQ